MKKGGAEMNGKAILTQTRNYSGTSEERLCYIVSQGFHLADKQNYLAMTAEPKFRCDHCGKHAVSCRNLCIPMEL
jgi:hypothetical protein